MILSFPVPDAHSGDRTITDSGGLRCYLGNNQTGALHQIKTDHSDGNGPVPRNRVRPERRWRGLARRLHLR